MLILIYLFLNACFLGHQVFCHWNEYVSVTTLVYIKNINIVNPMFTKCLKVNM